MAALIKDFVRVIGGGLAGAECALFLAKHGIRVKLYDPKPHKGSPAQIDLAHYGELVCSNSLKSNDPLSAPGLLKGEMTLLDSVVMKAGQLAKLPAGQDLAVDRQQFAEYITEQIKANTNIETIAEEIVAIPNDGRLTVICTGPLTSPALASWLSAKTGRGALSFFDATSPLVFKSSLDTTKMFVGSRWAKGEGHYLNCPLTKEQYQTFVTALTKAERVQLQDFEHFEECLPLEVMADRGFLTLKHGPLKEMGLKCPPDTYAIVQLRQDDAAESLYGLVGFQTNLKFGEQKRVFSLIPGLENAKFARFGVMHRNTYVNAPAVLNRDLSLKADNHLLLGGQLSGVEGYCESAGSGLLAGIYAYMRLTTTNAVAEVPLNTMLGSLVNYLIMSSPAHFAPMNATYGILVTDSRKDHSKCREEAQIALKAWIMSNKL